MYPSTIRIKHLLRRCGFRCMRGGGALGAHAAPSFLASMNRSRDSRPRAGPGDLGCGAADLPRRRCGLRAGGCARTHARTHAPSADLALAAGGIGDPRPRPDSEPRPSGGSSCHGRPQRRGGPGWTDSVVPSHWRTPPPPPPPHPSMRGGGSADSDASPPVCPVHMGTSPFQLRGPGQARGLTGPARGVGGRDRRDRPSRRSQAGMSDSLQVVGPRLVVEN
jgi:hypothetical protein